MIRRSENTYTAAIGVEIKVGLEGTKPNTFSK
jgi:hypothetical protein